jgi:hypothetical protein
MTNMEQVKERIERMRITRPDDNGLCKLLDFVEGLVKEENNINSKSKLAALDTGLREQMRGMEVCGLRYAAFLDVLQMVEVLLSEEQAEANTAERMVEEIKTILQDPKLFPHNMVIQISKVISRHNPKEAKQ